MAAPLLSKEWNNDQWTAFMWARRQEDVIQLLFWNWNIQIS